MCMALMFATDVGREKDGDKDGKVDPLAPMTEEVKVSCAEVVALLDLMEKTGYSMVQENGQRKYGGPPPGPDEYSRLLTLVLMQKPSLSCNICQISPKEGQRSHVGVEKKARPQSVHLGTWFNKDFFGGGKGGSQGEQKGTFNNVDRQQLLAPHSLRQPLCKYSKDIR